MTTSEDHPEVALGPNPFFDAVSPFIPFARLPEKMAHSPLKSIDWRKVPADRREPLLIAYEKHFAPTSALLEPAFSIQSLLRRTLVNANPIDKSVRKRCNEIGMVESRDDLRRIARTQGGGLLLCGITGTGKSAVLKRALETFVPEQVVDYGHSEAAGFYGLRQCVYLLVDHASNGTRGGLLKRVLQCLDEKVGTDYFSEHIKATNIDSLLVVVCKLLTLHRVAILCIDEKQESTFEDSPWRLEFALFYLQLMNLGVSVILSGNPLAFEHLMLYSQVVRRFSTGGIHTLPPATSGQENWWKRDFVPQARKFSIVENWSIDSTVRAQYEDENSGGLPGIFMAYHVEVQRLALRRADNSAEVCEQDYLNAQKSPRFVKLREISQHLKSSQAVPEHQFIDIPPTRELDKPLVTSNGPAITPAAAPQAATISAAQRLVAQYKSSQTRKATLISQQLKSFKTMSPEDIRSLGISTDLISGWEDQLAQLESSKSKRMSSRK